MSALLKLVQRVKTLPLNRERVFLQTTIFAVFLTHLFYLYRYLQHPQLDLQDQDHYLFHHLY